MSHAIVRIKDLWGTKHGLCHFLVKHHAGEDVFPYSVGAERKIQHQLARKFAHDLVRSGCAAEVVDDGSTEWPDEDALDELRKLP